MIVVGWYELHRAIDKAVPCYSPVPTRPYGDDGRCGECEGCRDYGEVEDHLSAVERAIEQSIALAESGAAI